MEMWEKRINFVAKHYKQGALDTEKAWKRLAADKGIARAIPFRRYIAAAAAAAILLLGITSIYIYESNKPRWVEITAAPGATKDVYLPDSTLVSLAADAHLRYDARRYGIKKREVRMGGKAYFRVKHDAARPFTVQANHAEVEVLGTAFQLRERPASVEVDVTEGTVRFSAGEKEIKDQIILTKGMSAIYSMETQKIDVRKDGNSNFLAWKTGVLSFHNTPLEEVLEDLTDYYNVPVKSKLRLRGERLTATFESLPVDHVLLIINQTLDVRLFVDKKDLKH